MTDKPVASRTSGTSGNPKAGHRKWPHNFHVSPAVVPRMEKSLFDRKKDLRPKPHGQLGLDDLDVKHRCVGYIHERHTSSSSSSWSRLYGEVVIYQESTPEVCETVIPSD